ARDIALALNGIEGLHGWWLPAWTSNTCFPRAGPDSEDSGATRKPDALRRPASRRTSPRKPSLRTGTRSSRCAGRSSDLRTGILRSAYLLPLPSHGGPVHVGAFVSALPLRGSSGFTPDSLSSPADVASGRAPTGTTYRVPWHWSTQAVVCQRPLVLGAGAARVRRCPVRRYGCG